MNSKATISIVIPMFNAQASIGECLHAIGESFDQPLEVIVVDDGSRDGSLAIASKFPIKLVSKNCQGGAAAARNMGIAEAKGDLILLLDSDIIIPKDMITIARQRFAEQPDMAVAQGVYSKVSYYKDIFSQYKNLIFAFRGHQDHQKQVAYVHTACVIGRAKAFKTHQFNENLKRREDIEYGLRLAEEGYKIVTFETMAATHKKQFNLRSFSRYQICAARDAVTQRYYHKDNNIKKEFQSAKTPLFKKLWMLRPVFGVTFALNIIAAILIPRSFWNYCILAQLILACWVELPFRMYLLRNAWFKISIAAIFLYFYDGMLIASGIFLGLFAILRTKLENEE